MGMMKKEDDLKKIGKKRTHQSLTHLSEFLFGAPYYPEHWTEKELEFDPERMTKAGFNVVRMAEFAWDRIEPEEGKFDFRFFDDHINRLGAVGIKTILCTPTATPPRWLTEKYPEMLRVNHDGVKMQHGSRQHACHSSPVFREYSRKITDAMAAHYQKNEYVMGWQTDNEFFCHFSECHCESCQEAFRGWVSKEYETVDELNRRWGTSFWALTFSKFDQIQTPRVGKPTHLNPSQHLDYLIFLSDEVTEFQREQVDILRRENSDWFIFHNGKFTGIDYQKFSEDLDFMGIDIYPKFSRTKERRFNTDWTLNITRSFSGNFIIPELQSGAGGQKSYSHDNPVPGEMRLYAYQCVAQGADGILHFRWRTCRFGAEEFWGGILDHDNVPRRRFEEICQEGLEFKKIGPEILPTYLAPEIGILTDSGMAEMAERTNGCGVPNMNSNTWCWLTAWSKENYHAGLVHPEDDLNCFRLLILPSWEIVTESVVKKLEEFVERGGVLVITARSGIKNADNQVLAETRPGLLRNLVGGTIYESSRVNDSEEHPNALQFESMEVDQYEWIEWIEPEEAEVVATWTKGHMRGKAAATVHCHHSHGKVNNDEKGKCYYIGTFVDEGRAGQFVPYFSKVANLKPLLERLPEGVQVSRREHQEYDLWFILNHNKEKVNLPEIPKGDFLVDDRKGNELPGFGVVVLKEFKNLN